MENIVATSFASTPSLSSVAVQARPPPLSLSFPVSDLITTGLEIAKPLRRTTSTSNTIQVARATATYLPSTTLEMFHVALDAELAFLEEHQPAAVRCFNNNMLRLAQSGMSDEVPRGARPAVGEWEGYAAQLKALKGIVGEVVDERDQQRRDERLVLGRVGWDTADVLVQVEEDEDGEEQVRVTGVVDWEFAGVVPQWMVAGLPDFLRSSSSPTDDDDADDANDVEQQKGDDTLPFLDEDSATWVLPTAIRTDDRLAAVWRVTLDMEQQEQQWEREELVRAAWKVVNVEWHEVQRGCAWARGYLASHHYQHQHQHLHSSTAIACQLDTQNERYLTFDVPSDGECSSAGRSGGTNDTQETVESAMPATPTEDEVPRPPAAASIKGSQVLGFGGFFFSGRYSNEDDDEKEEGSDDHGESDEEEEDDSESTSDSASASHDWRDEFERAFMFSAPLSSNTPSRTSHALLQPSASRAQQRKMAEERTRRQQKFKQGMNDPLPHAGYEVLWEEPPPPTMDDLEFMVERDLDAGW